MTLPIPDLWPVDLEQQGVVPPVAILRQQAARLGDKTQNLVTAEVVSETCSGMFQYSFELVAPALGHYQYALFSVVYGLELYPVEIRAGFLDTPLKAATEEEFLQVLRTVLSSKETKRIISSLLVQSKA